MPRWNVWVLRFFGFVWAVTGLWIVLYIFNLANNSVSFLRGLSELEWVSLILFLYVIPFLFAVILALRRYRKLLRQIEDSYNLICPQCGYDMRATPARCPECGQLNDRI